MNTPVSLPLARWAASIFLAITIIALAWSQDSSPNQLTASGLDKVLSLSRTDKSCSFRQSASDPDSVGILSGIANADSVLLLWQKSWHLLLSWKISGWMLRPQWWLLIGQVLDTSGGNDVHNSINKIAELRAQVRARWIKLKAIAIISFYLFFYLTVVNVLTLRKGVGNRSSTTTRQSQTRAEMRDTFLLSLS